MPSNPKPAPMPKPILIPRTEPPRPGKAWQHQAACKDMDPSWFFPEEWRERGVYTPGITPGQKQYEREGLLRRVKSVCARCPVAAECLSEAIRDDDRDAIRGGLTYRERGKLGLQARRRDTRPKSTERIAS